MTFPRRGLQHTRLVAKARQPPLARNMTRGGNAKSKVLCFMKKTNNNNNNNTYNNNNNNNSSNNNTNK